MTIIKLYVRIVTACVYCSLFAVSSWAEQSPQTINALKAAESEIANYKAKRKICAESENDARKACFSELNAASERYTLAKKVVAASKREPEPNAIHYVSFTQ